MSNCRECRTPLPSGWPSTYCSECLSSPPPVQVLPDAQPIKLSLPRFGGMSIKVKEELARRFRPEYCPNCGRPAAEYTGVKVEELISSVPCWNIACGFCGVEYSVRITRD